MHLQYQLINFKTIAKLIVDFRINKKIARFYIHIQNLCVFVNHIFKFINLYLKFISEKLYSRVYFKSYIYLENLFIIIKQLINLIFSNFRVLLFINQLN